MNQSESANTVPNQIAGLSQKYQRTFDGIKKKFVASKKIVKEKWKAYNEYIAFGLEQWSALARGEEISKPKYSPDTEKKLEQEYRDASRRVYIIRQELKRFMIKHGLEFQEPKAESDSD
ncbi:hypothetical protein QVD99_005843 [Batrachochytrium dendrobatidis]|nr:hypothetical protein QVD99_005843 [Batrachochytrium dendrobatidis]